MDKWPFICKAEKLPNTGILQKFIACLRLENMFFKSLHKFLKISTVSLCQHPVFYSSSSLGHTSLVTIGRMERVWRAYAFSWDIKVNIKSNPPPSLGKRKPLFPSLISNRGTKHIPAPTPRVTPGARRAGAGGGRERQGSDLAPLLPDGSSTQPLDPRGLPGGGAETHAH